MILNRNCYDDTLLQTNRKFHEIILDGTKMDTRNLIEIFKTHGSTITRLYVIRCCLCLDRFDSFKELLKLLPNLEHLTLHQLANKCGIPVAAKKDFPELMKLKTIDLLDSDSSIIKCFKRLRLNALKVVNVNSKLLLHFLRSQRELTTFSFPSTDYNRKLEKLIELLPNVTDLTLLENCVRRNVELIASNLKNLNKLTVNRFSEATFGGLQFPNLISLNVKKIEADVNWNEFTLTNSTITELVVDGFGYWTVGRIMDFIKTTTRNLGLQTLKIGSHHCANERFCDIIRRKCKNLKVLSLKVEINDIKSDLLFHNNLITSFIEYKPKNGQYYERLNNTKFVCSGNLFNIKNIGDDIPRGMTSSIQYVNFNSDLDYTSDEDE